MKKTNLTMRLFSLMLVLVIVAAMAFTLASCGNTNDGGSDTDTNAVSDTAADTADDTDAAKDTADADTSGEEKAEITITVQVKGSDGNITDFVITTEEEFLRGALEQEDLVQGDESEFGLYVKVVNGETADYDANGAYWAFYKGDEYLMTGVDTTPIEDGDVFRIEYTIG
ncbi:MAG: DUF4430 domain-containing protein [Clostridia bacterium]|nr:DUF4430 domain-containing protein [Clostridia bacterium]